MRESTFPFGRERGWQCAIRRRDGPGDNDEMREIEKIVPAMPRRQPREGIVTNDQRQWPGRGFVVQFRQRDDRVAWPRAADLARVDLEIRIVGECLLDHRESMRRRGDWRGGG